MTAEENIEWQFEFGLATTDEDQSIPQAKCDELMELIIRFAVSNGYYVGGGYREFKETAY